MNKMINPRSGHGPAFGIEILYALVAMILGWPVAIPLMAVEMFISDTFHYKLPIGIFWVDVLLVFMSIIKYGHGFTQLLKHGGHDENSTFNKLNRRLYWSYQCW